MGLAGLTAVFGMGTGVTPPVWSPEMRPPGGQAGAGTWFLVVGHTPESVSGDRSVIELRFYSFPDQIARPIAGPAFGSPFGLALSEAAPRSGWSSCLAVRTGRLKRSPAVHARPIDLVVFQEPMSR